MPTIEVALDIRSPREQVYKILKDMESFPSFMRDVKNIKIIKEVDGHIVISWETEVEGAPVHWREEDFFDDANYQMKFNLLDGSYKGYNGLWSVENSLRGSRLKLRADFDWGIPILEKYVGKALEEKARRGLLGMLQAIKIKAEKANV